METIRSVQLRNWGRGQPSAEALSLDCALEFTKDGSEEKTAVGTAPREILTEQGWRWVPGGFFTSFPSESNESQCGNPLVRGKPLVLLKGLISGVREPGSPSQLQLNHVTLSHLVKFSGPPFPHLSRGQ